MGVVWGRGDVGLGDDVRCEGDVRYEGDVGLGNDVRCGVWE